MLRKRWRQLPSQGCQSRTTRSIAQQLDGYTARFWTAGRTIGAKPGSVAGFDSEMNPPNQVVPSVASPSGRTKIDEAENVVPAGAISISFHPEPDVAK
jgi:hypothetical protein